MLDTDSEGSGSWLEVNSESELGYVSESGW